MPDTRTAEPLPVGAYVASALMAANIPCDSGEDVDRFLGLLAERGYHVVAHQEAADTSELREALDSALDELDNIRWDDVFTRIDAGGEDDLARWTMKYVGYVRDDIEKARAALSQQPTPGTGIPRDGQKCAWPYTNCYTRAAPATGTEGLDWKLRDLLRGTDDPANWGVPEDYAAGWVAAINAARAALGTPR